MNRKELLLEEADSKRVLTREEEQKLRKAVDDGGAYLDMVNSRGWQKLLEEHINVELSQERYLTAKVEDLADIRAAQRALVNLLRFVNAKVEDGKKSLSRLRELSTQGG